MFTAVKGFLKAFFLIFLLLILGCADGNDSDDQRKKNEEGFPKLGYSNEPVPELAGNIFVELEVWNRSGSDESEGWLFLIDPEKAVQDEDDILTVNSWYSTVSVSPNGRFLVYRDDSTGTVVYDILADSIIHESDYYPNPSDQYAWLGSGVVFWGDYFSGIFSVDIINQEDHSHLYSSYRTYDHSVDISPDGEYIAWVHHEWGNEVTVYLALLSDHFSYGDAQIVWSGESYWHDEQLHLRFIDKERFYFVIAEKTEVNSNENVYLYDIAADQLKKVISNRDITDPKLSNAKDKIVFISSDSMSYRGLLGVIDVGSWKVSYIDDLGEQIVGFAWSPEDDYIMVVTEVNDYYEGVNDFFDLILYPFPSPGQKWFVTSIDEDTEDWYLHVNGVAWGPGPVP